MTIFIRKLLACVLISPVLLPAQQSMQERVQGLTSPDDATRIEAIYTLGRSGPGALPELSKMLGSTKSRAAAGAAQSLYVMGNDAVPSLPTLYRALASPNSVVRQWSLRAVGRATQHGDDGIPHLSAYLSDSDPAVRKAAIDALLDIKRTNGMIAALSAMTDPDSDVRLHLVQGLQAYWHFPRAVSDSLCSALRNDKSAEVRARAAETLSASEPSDTAVAFAMTGALGDGDQSVREAAAKGLENLAQLTAKIQQDLQARWNGSNDEERATALVAIAMTEPNHKKAAKIALTAIGNPNPKVRTAASEALNLLLRTQPPEEVFNLGPERNKDSVDLLDANNRMRILAVSGPYAVRAQAIPAYTRLTKLTIELVSSAEEAKVPSVEAINGDTNQSSFHDAITALVSQLASPYSSIRIATMSSIADLWDADYDLRVKASSLTPRERVYLTGIYYRLDALASVSGSIAHNVAGVDATVKTTAISTLGFSAHKISLLLRQLDRAEMPDDEALAMSTIKLQDKLSNTEQLLRRTIKSAFSDSRPDVRSAAAEAAANAKLSDPSTIKQLVSLLRDPAAEVRIHAAHAFETMDDEEGAQDAYESLRTPIHDANPNVATAALSAAVYMAYHIQEYDGERVSGLLQHSVPLLASADDVLRGQAARAVGTFGRANRQTYAARLLSAVLEDPSKTVRYDAISTLREYAKSHAESTLQACMVGARDEVTSVREQALLCFKDEGVAARPALPLIITNLDDKNTDVRRDAAEAIPAFGADARDAVPALTRDLSKEPNSILRSYFLNALAAIGPAAAPATLELLKIARDQDERNDISAVLERIGPDALSSIQSEITNAEGDYRAYLVHLREGLERVRDGVTLQLLTKTGTIQAVAVPRGTVVAALATWCPYSREFRDKVVAEQTETAASQRKYIFLFADEHPYVESELNQLAKEESWSEAERRSNADRLSASFKGTPFMNPDFLKDLPGDVYLVPSDWKLMPESFPSVYSFIDDKFSINGLAWLDDNSTAPRSGMDELTAIFRKIGQRAGGRQSRNPTVDASKHD